MQLSNSHKQKIYDAMESARSRFTGSDARFAASIGINGSVYSRLKKGDFDKVLSEGEWLRVGRKLNVVLNEANAWHIAPTDAYSYITTQMAYCQKYGAARIFCDKADVGKTTAAKDYISKHRNVVYVDCSQVKTLHTFIRELADQFGVESAGKLKEVRQDLIFYIQSLESPMIILDEAGDLSYPAWLEVKALWNALEGVCGWYMLGADGLAAKMNRHVRSRKVGYAEIFRRFGSSFQQSTPLSNNEADFIRYFLMQAEAIVNANLPGADVKPLDLLKVKGNKVVYSLTLLKERIIKFKREAKK